jgi:hypothetical protein
VARLFVILSLLLLVPSASWQPPAEDACAVVCPEDDEGGQCPPDCTDCVCCTHAAPLALPAATPPGLSWPVLHGASPGRESTPPPDVEPGDILHVPIRSLA